MAVWPKLKSWISTTCSWAARQPTLERLWPDTTSSSIHLPPKDSVCSSCVPPYSSDSRRSISDKINSPNPMPRTIIYLICWMCPIAHTLTSHTNSVSSCSVVSKSGIYIASLCSASTHYSSLLQVRRRTNSVRWQFFLSLKEWIRVIAMFCYKTLIEQV